MSVTPIQQPSPQPDYLARYQAIFGRDGFLNKYNIERREEIELLGLSSISGIDVLLLGNPGVGKTWAIELLVNQALVDMKLYTHMLIKEQGVAELLGSKDVMAMKQGIERRITVGYLPEAHYAYLDEIFKAAPGAINPLLDIMANRVLKVGGQVIDCSQLVSIFFSSNELPDREDLMAFRDRIAVTKKVEPVKTREGRRAVTDLQLAYDANARKVDTTGLVPLTLVDIIAIRNEVAQVTVSDAIRDLMGVIEERCLEAGHEISQRRKRDIWRMVKAHAWAAGRSAVIADDFLPAQHMTWNLPDHIKSGQAIILELASVSSRAAARLKEALEPVEASLSELKVKLTAASTDAERDSIIESESGFKFLRQLRALQRDGNEQVAQAQAEGQDTSMVEGVVAEIKRAHDWAENMLATGQAE